ncbi:hypothetical protein LY78DRAFT_184589 [Colletotrichum sublineola]|nr:hypothetical protein LY78DRAFT_184589 [Colletotrichum sublineola]
MLSRFYNFRRLLGYSFSSSFSSRYAIPLARTSRLFGTVDTVKEALTQMHVGWSQRFWRTRKLVKVLRKFRFSSSSDVLLKGCRLVLYWGGEGEVEPRRAMVRDALPFLPADFSFACALTLELCRQTLRRAHLDDALAWLWLIDPLCRDNPSGTPTCSRIFWF